MQQPTSAPAGIPRYQCHKVVRAAKIARIDEMRPSPRSNEQTEQAFYPASLKLQWYPDGVASILADEAWMAKHRPQVGGYYVTYEDGYTSFSPAAPFEEGYRRIPNEEPRTDWTSCVANLVMLCLLLAAAAGQAWAANIAWFGMTLIGGISLCCSLLVDKATFRQVAERGARPAGTPVLTLASVVLAASMHWYFSAFLFSLGWLGWWARMQAAKRGAR